MKKLLSSLGPVSAVIGAQWGDEGKGKIIDILSEHFDVIARGAGGANAGHTIVVNGKKHVFRLLPSGSLHERKPVILGAGMVIHLPTLLEEINMLEDAGLDILSRLSIAPNAHIVFGYHKEIDGMLEEQRTKKKGEGIGTTKRGIGPAYMEKAARSGLRMESLLWSEDHLRQEVTAHAEDAGARFGVPVDADHEVIQILEAKKILERNIIPNLVDHMAGILGKNTLLIEGAQATLLDLDFGTYPFVTSSNTTVMGALQGLGLAPKWLSSVIGVAKAYCTRVGSGAFPTEADGEVTERLRDRGGEYGSVTRRPRRCGWLSIPDLKYSAQLNGFTCWNITKLDVLDEENVIPVAMNISPDGKPTYKELPGWKQNTAGITEFEMLPPAAQDFIAFIEQETGIPVSCMGTGQQRNEMIVRN